MEISHLLPSSSVFVVSSGGTYVGEFLDADGFEIVVGGLEFLFNLADGTSNVLALILLVATNPTHKICERLVHHGLHRRADGLHDYAKTEAERKREREKGNKMTKRCWICGCWI
jgi:hypothetical protein